MKMGFRWSKLLLHRVGDLVGRLRPLVDDRSWRSSCVIRPMSYWSWISATSASYLPRISAFSGGITTSFFETVMPACVA